MSSAPTISVIRPLSRRLSVSMIHATCQRASRPLGRVPDATDQWFPQLSSKQPGTVDDGIRWDYDSIWREHLRLRQQYGAVLLWSGDWPRTFKKPDYWVTIAWYYAFPDADGAREWCQNHGRDSDHCYPTQIQ